MLSVMNSASMGIILEVTTIPGLHKMHMRTHQMCWIK